MRALKYGANEQEQIHRLRDQTCGRQRGAGGGLQGEEQTGSLGSIVQTITSRMGRQQGPPG